MSRKRKPPNDGLVPGVVLWLPAAGACMKSIKPLLVLLLVLLRNAVGRTSAWARATVLAWVT